MSQIEGNRDKLVQDFHAVVADAEQLLKSVAAAGGEKTVALRESAERSLKAARARLAELEGAAEQKARAAVGATDAYVKGHPWQSVAVAAGVAAVVGMIVGLLLNRR